MHKSLTPVPKTIQELVETLSNAGVVCTTAADGELLLELYSLLEYLEPDEHDLAARLSQLRLVPASTLPQAQALRQGLATAPALHRGDLP